MSFIIEGGKCYRTRAGHKVGPLRPAGKEWQSCYKFEGRLHGATHAWTATGRFFSDSTDEPRDLVAEWHDEAPAVAIIEGPETQAALAEQGQAAVVPEAPEPPPAQRVHELKSWVGLFGPIASGEKTHDLRVMDRDFRVGDQCRLREWEPTTRTFTGRECTVWITYITSGSGAPGHNACAFSPVALHPGMAVLSIRLVEHRPAA